MTRPLSVFRTLPLSRVGRQLAAGAMAGVLALTPTAPVRSQEGSLNLIRDAEIETILRADTDPIFKAAGLVPKNVELHLVNSPDLQAFVAGGQHLFLYTGLIIKTETPNQLIGVIAHETGHIAGGHLARRDESNKSALATYVFTMGLGLLAALAGGDGGGAAAGMIYSANYFATLQVLGYTRIQESSADQAAATFLERSGQSGEGLVDFFNNFRYQEVFSDARRDAYFRSHPLSGDRIEALRARVAEQPHFDVKDTPEAIAAHQIMIAKLKAFMNYPQQTLSDYPETDQTYPAKYARAIAYYRELNTDKAVSAIDALIVDQPNNPYLWELKGQALFEAGRAKEAEPAHRRSMELAPNSALLRINLGQTLLAMPGDTGVREAIVHLNRALDTESENPLAWRLLAEAYERNGDAGLARLATAEQNFALGQLVPARTFALRARDLLAKNTPQYQRANDIINTSEDNFQGRRKRS